LGVIGLNMTITDKPDFDFSNSTSVAVHSVKSSSLPFRFLSLPLTVQDSNVTVFQTIGVKGAIYPFSQNFTYLFPDAVDMKFDPIFLKNAKVVLLLSDYSLNTAFFMGQQSGNLWKTIKNDTVGLPFTIDTNGLGLIVPELTNFFKGNNYNCTMKVGIQGKHKQPVITTQEDGSNLYLNLGIYIDVNNETTIMDDPFTAVNLDLEFNIKLMLYTDNDKLSVKFGAVSAKSVNATSFIGPIDTDKSKKTLESIVKVAIGQAAGDLKNIDIVGMLLKYTGLTFYDLIIDKNNGHHSISLNYEDQ